MPHSGFCADLKCDREMKRLYECHCCSQSICLNHLNEHDEKDKFRRLIERLRTKTDTIRLNIENRLKIIERETIFIQQERKFLEQANHLLDGQYHSIGDIEKILEEECIVKVEPLFSNVTNCSSTENNDQDEYSLKLVSVESKSEMNIEFTQDSENEYSMTMDQSISTNLSDNSFQDTDENEERGLTVCRFIGRCPLTFDGAYGISKSKHSIRVCSFLKQRSVKLYAHFTALHKLKPTSARCLIEAIAKNRDPRTTKLFDNNEDIVDHSNIIKCPFKNGTIHLVDCQKEKNIRRVPCKYQTVYPSTLKIHLINCHRLSKNLAQQLAQPYKDNRTKKLLTSSMKFLCNYGNEMHWNLTGKIYL